MNFRRSSDTGAHTPLVSATRPRGLVCDDEPASRRAVEAILAGCGFEVVASVGSAAEALVATELSSPDVVVLDLALAGDLGLRLIAALRFAQPGCAVVVLSSFTSLRRPALDAGAYDFVADAGADLRELEACLRRLVDERARVALLDHGPVDAPPADQPGDQVEAAGTSSSRHAPAGTRRTKAPSS